MTNLLSPVRFLRQGGIGKTLAKVLPDTPWASYILSSRVFKRTYGFRPRLQRPRTLNEWLFARKVTLPRSVSFAPWVDKHLAKESVEQALTGLDAKCHIAKTLHHSTNADDAFFSGLLPRCVVKGTHGSGMNILIESPRHLTEAEKASMRQWLETEYFWGSREPSYRHLQPSIIAEEFLPCDGLVPEDFKFFCFRGKVAFIQHDTGRYIDHRRCLYSPSWDRLPVTLAHDQYDHQCAAPKDLSSMLAIAQRLSERQNFVRVDLYQTDAGVYFGEMTFFPGSGLEVFEPLSFDEDIYQRWMAKAA
ncbi:MAG: ATP-grasp fold amidoligase family protein [Prosthecobacter sp.]